MSGFEFLSVVRRRFPKISVIASSRAYGSRAVPTGVLADASQTSFQWVRATQIGLRDDSNSARDGDCAGPDANVTQLVAAGG